MSNSSRAPPTGCDSVQKPDGSFGETCDSYEDPSLKGIGESTPSQTAWGAMGMMAVVGANDPAVQRAHRLADRTSERRRQLGRELLHRHRLSTRLLSDVSLLSSLFSAHGDGEVPTAQYNEWVRIGAKLQKHHLCPICDPLVLRTRLGRSANHQARRNLARRSRQAHPGPRRRDHSRQRYLLLVWRRSLARPRSLEKIRELLLLR